MAIHIPFIGIRSPGCNLTTPQKARSVGGFWHGFAFRRHSGHASTGMFVKIVSAFPVCVASAFLAFSLVGVAPATAQDAGSLLREQLRREELQRLDRLPSPDAVEQPTRPGIIGVERGQTLVIRDVRFTGKLELLPEAERARLAPGETQQSSRLVIGVEEAPRFSAMVSGDNFEAENQDRAQYRRDKLESRIADSAQGFAEGISDGVEPGAGTDEVAGRRCDVWT
jgi:hypothetical protein